MTQDSDGAPTINCILKPPEQMVTQVFLTLSAFDFFKLCFFHNEIGNPGPKSFFFSSKAHSGFLVYEHWLILLVISVRNLKVDLEHWMSLFGLFVSWQDYQHQVQLFVCVAPQTRHCVTLLCVFILACLLYFGLPVVFESLNYICFCLFVIRCVAVWISSLWRWSVLYKPYSLNLIHVLWSRRFQSSTDRVNSNTAVLFGWDLLSFQVTLSKQMRVMFCYGFILSVMVSF